MKIGGFESCTLLDFSGKVSCIVYTVGCNFRCKYCYNPDIISDQNFSTCGRPQILESYVLDYIEKHTKMLDGVVITGGEPTLQFDLPLFCQKIKWLDKSVKLDTNGSNPEMLQTLINNKLVDYVAMDLKAPLDKYEAITSYKDTKNVEKSINILKKSGIPHEFRLTLYPQLTIDDIARAIDLVPGETIYLQNFEPAHSYSEDARQLKAIPKQIVEKIAESKKDIAKVYLRGF